MLRLLDVLRRHFRSDARKVVSGAPTRARLNLTALEARDVPSVVTVAKIADATEGTTAGTFRFTRTDTTGTLAVNYAVSGTATSGTDFTALSGTVNFANGAATATVIVTTIDDELDDPSETVRATIGTGVGYTIGGINSAEMFIADNPPAGEVTEALIDFANLPAAGTAYTLKITVVGTTAGTTKTVTVDNSMGVNTPQDTRDAVRNALGNDTYWRVEEVGTTKLKVKHYYQPANPPMPAVSSRVKDIEIGGKDLKDNQKPKYTLTRIAATDSAADRAVVTTGGGTWALGFATNPDALVLPDDVLMTVTVQRAGGPTSVLITLTANMTPGAVATAVANGLTNAGFAFTAFGSEATFGDPTGEIDSITVAYSSIGSNPVANWLTESIGFRDF